MSPLKEIVDGITSLVSKIEDDLKVRGAEYNNVRSQLNAINRKQSGSLAVRDLSNIVKTKDVVSSEHLTTLLAIVPKYSQKDWLTSYETLTQYVDVYEQQKELVLVGERVLLATLGFDLNVLHPYKSRANRGFEKLSPTCECRFETPGLGSGIDLNLTGVFLCTQMSNASRSMKDDLFTARPESISSHPIDIKELRQAASIRQSTEDLRRVTSAGQSARCSSLVGIDHNLCFETHCKDTDSVALELVGIEI